MPEQTTRSCPCCHRPLPVGTYVFPGRPTTDALEANPDSVLGNHRARIEQLEARTARLDIELVEVVGAAVRDQFRKMMRAVTP